MNEPFSCSGSQFIAAEQLGRKVNSRLLDVIIKRWLALGEARRVICSGKILLIGTILSTNYT